MKLSVLNGLNNPPKNHKSLTSAMLLGGVLPLIWTLKLEASQLHVLYGDESNYIFSVADSERHTEVSFN